MKGIYKIVSLIISFLIGGHLYAQQHGSNNNNNNSLHINNIINQQQGINGILKASTNANVNAKIHANSNSIIVNGNRQVYNSKNAGLPKSEKPGEIKNNNVKRQKK